MRLQQDTMTFGCVHSPWFGLTYLYSPTLCQMMAPSCDVERRIQKRIYNIWVVESSAAYMRYLEGYSFGSVKDFYAPDPFDVSISCRRWKWLMREYDQTIKQVSMKHDVD